MVKDIKQGRGIIIESMQQFKVADREAVQPDIAVFLNTGDLVDML